MCLACLFFSVCPSCHDEVHVSLLVYMLFYIQNKIIIKLKRTRRTKKTQTYSTECRLSSLCNIYTLNTQLNYIYCCVRECNYLFFLVCVFSLVFTRSFHCSNHTKKHTWSWMIVCCCRAARAIKKIANKRCMLQENKKRLYVANQRHNHWDIQKENASREISFSISGIIIKTHLSFWAVLKSSSNSLENTRLRKNNKFILIPTLKWLPAKDKKKTEWTFSFVFVNAGNNFY